SNESLQMRASRLGKALELVAPFDIENVVGCKSRARKPPQAIRAKAAWVGRKERIEEAKSAGLCIAERASIQRVFVEDQRPNRPTVENVMVNGALGIEKERYFGGIGLRRRSGWKRKPGIDVVVEIRAQRASWILSGCPKLAILRGERIKVDLSIRLQKLRVHLTERRAVEAVEERADGGGVPRQLAGG